MAERAAPLTPWLLTEDEAAIIRAHMASLGPARWLWAAGLALDVPALLLVWPDASWAAVLGARALGAPLHPLITYVARRPGVRSMTVARLTLSCVPAFAALIAWMASALGGLESPYLLGLTLFISAAELGSLVRLRLIYGLIAVTALVWTAVLALAARWDANVAAQWASTRSVALYVGQWLFLLGFAAVGLRAAEQVAGLRRELAVARRLAGYRLEARLGAGGMNEVWLARPERGGAAVALKILQRMPSEVARRRFEREADALRALRSPHTVRVLDVGSSDDGVMFIAMEAVGGVDLERLVRSRGPLPLARAVALAGQACASLDEAHRAGVIHRDVKPSNLMVSPRAGRDHLTVIDFGIAHVDAPDATALTVGCAFVGTPHYMAPEAFGGAAPSPAVDVYGLGATLRFLLTGRRPFHDLTGLALMTAVLHDPPTDEPMPDAPEALRALIARCLAKDPADRPPSVAALDDALAAIAREHPWEAADHDATSLARAATDDEEPPVTEAATRAHPRGPATTPA